MAFLYRDATNETVYALTAGHCLDEIGSPVFLSDPVDEELTGDIEEPKFGTVAYASQFDSTTERDWDWVPDYGLIQIDEAMRDRLNPQTTHWGGPSDIWQPGDDDIGQVVCAYGQGAGFGWTESTRPRCGEIEGRNGPGKDLVMAWIPAAWGDSGGPVVHESGRAAGIMKGALGPLVAFVDLCFIHEAMRLAGIDLELLTAAPSDIAYPLTSPSIGLYDTATCRSP